MSVATIQLAAQPALAQIKHMNRLEQVLAAQQAQAEQVDECFVLDQAEQLVSVIAGNVFLVRSGELLTPLLVDCGVRGTRRRLIIEKWAPSIGLKVREARLTLHDLHSAQEVFYSNSLQTVRPVAALGDQYWDNHDVCEALFLRYLEDLS
jgi:4-amino-4-deoxychorismate lyase